MNLLEQSELIFGRMMHIEEPHLIERYNLAMKGFGLKQTKLTSFRIDMTGYSPEVAEELNDLEYLDPHGINRRFIILSPEQQFLPVVHTSFSNTGQLMHEFFDGNRRAINALTIKDVIYGEIDDPVLEAHDIEDLLAIEQVTFKVFTGQNLTSQAGELRELIDRLQKEPDAWQNNDLLNEMVRLAEACGDIRNNDLVPSEVIFRHNTFWSSHFGGVYVFIDEDQTTVIGDRSAPGFRRSRPWQVSYIDQGDSDLVYRFLLQTGRIEPPRGSWLERAGYIEHRVKMLVAMLAWHQEPMKKHNPDDGRWMKSWVNNNTDLVEEEGTLPFLLWAEREFGAWGTVDINEIDARGRFILSRAKPGHEDNWLVNRLISDYVPFDFVSRYVFNKPAFYSDYENWSQELKSFAVESIVENYLNNKSTLRQRLYGMSDD